MLNPDLKRFGALPQLRALPSNSHFTNIRVASVNLCLILLPSIFILNAEAATFRAHNKVYVTNLKPKAKTDITIERLSFRRITTNQCGEALFASTTMPTAIAVGEEVFNPTKFPIDSKRKCTKDRPKSSQSYKSAPTKFAIAGLKPNTVVSIKIISPEVRKISANSCGYSAITITTSLTAFSNSYEENIYSVNGVKLAEMPMQAVPKCRKS